MSVRTRVAPSPTGDPHVGTAYVALFNYAFARQHGGQILLRIEDTDRVRSSDTSETAILEALRWTGLDWDEGPDVGGPHGPYRQSERIDLYREHADTLLRTGAAFRCFCTQERLDALRRDQQARGETPRYDGHCLALDPAEASERAARGEAHVVRLDVPGTGTCRFNDGLRGEIEIPWAQTDMQVLVKSDGFPTYHLAVVVDDHLMEISHVLRGEEWISSMPKHRLLYDRFGWEMPAHYHLPLLRNPDSSKLSKRRNPTGLDYYRRSGYLPEALLNYLALMGWSMPDEQEVFSLAEMIEAFDIERVSTGGPVFDFAKLDWMNGQHIRRLSPDEFMDRVGVWAINRTALAPLVPLVQQRTERLSDLVAQVDYLLGDRRPLASEDFDHKRLEPGDCKRILDHATRRLDDLHDWNRDTLHDSFRALAEAMGIGMRDFLAPLFIAISGRAVSLPLFDAMAYLGRDLVRARLRSALEALGGVSKKETKRLERSYREL
ncbi:MAG: glutamate--tRNA ligase [Gammaproteobacteria bacterium]|nr:glutamate--tRNA ligase [Gammaproteobacteria bacterium]